MKLDLLEPQSLSLEEIVEQKVRQAYTIAQRPVLVEDTSLEFCALGRLPGTFIKFFLEEMGPEALCKLLEGKSRVALAATVYGYFDGTILQLFRASHPGEIAESPR
jgi:inosine/xanthosine triphosphate pyrophosphatase family protein